MQNKTSYIILCFLLLALIACVYISAHGNSAYYDAPVPSEGPSPKPEGVIVPQIINEDKG